MLHIFNRKELLLTNDLREVNRVREILLANRLDYSVKASYPRSTHAIGMDRNRMDSFGTARQQERFTVYVRKSDYDYAMYQIGRASCRERV